MTTPDDLAEKEDFLRNWAADNKCAYDPEGECGFGRECVGITYGGHWVDLGPPKQWENFSFPEVLPEAHAPEGVNAYHKHDCLAVLGRGPVAIDGLYLWVRKISDANLVVKVSPRPQKMDAINLIIHGATVPHLAYKGAA